MSITPLGTAAGADLERAWQSLAERTHAGPFHRPDYVAVWRSVFGKGELRPLAVYRHGRLRAALPLERIGPILRSPTNWHTPEYGSLAEDAGAARELADALLALRAPATSLGFLDTADPLWPALRQAAAESGHRLDHHVSETPPYLELAGDWLDYRAALDADFRRELRRRRRRLQEIGEVRLDVVEGGPQLDLRLAEGMRVEGMGWKAAQGSAILSDPAVAGFYRALAHWAGERGWLRLAFLRVSGRAVAFDFSVECDGVHHLLKTGYDPALSRYSPGNLLREAMLERAFAAGLRRYEFGGRADPWKLNWTPHTHERLRVRLFARSAPGRVAAAAVRGGRPLLRRMAALRSG